MRKVLLLLFFIIVPILNLKAQDECCGLGSIMGMLVQTGVSGGYGIQNFNAEGLNHYIDVYNQNTPGLQSKMNSFGDAKGYKVGLNIVQFLVNKWVIGLRFHYQWIKEKNSSEALVDNGKAKREYELSLSQLALGFTLSYYLGRNFDLKILDIMATSNGANLVDKYVAAEESIERKLKNPGSTIGLNAGAGFTVYLIPPYIGIETTAGYSFLKVNSLDMEGGRSITRDENSNVPMSNFIKSGGFFAFAQLNLAIPF